MAHIEILGTLGKRQFDLIDSNILHILCKFQSLLSVTTTENDYTISKVNNLQEKWISTVQSSWKKIESKDFKLRDEYEIESNIKINGHPIKAKELDYVVQSYHLLKVEYDCIEEQNTVISKILTQTSESLYPLLEYILKVLNYIEGLNIKFRPSLKVS